VQLPRLAAGHVGFQRGADDLPLLAELYRRWSVDLDETATRDSAAEHKALLDAALARDAELAVDLLATQIRTTHDGLSKNL
jgi:DNA-binding GntR family transcriptional regulator